MRSYIRESSIYKRLWVYRNIAPVFSYLLTMIGAFLLAENFPILQKYTYVGYSLAFAFLILAFQYNRKFFSLCFFFCFSVLYYNYRVDFSPPTLTETEVTLDIRVNGINTTCDRYISGYASILDGYDFDSDLRGREIFFVIYGNEPKVDIGSRLNLLGTLKPVGEELHSFDSFLARQKISYRLISSDDKVSPLSLGAFAESLQAARAYILSSIENSSKENARYLPMYRALMIGDMSKVDKVDKQKFARSASIHIFAISGLHVGLVASLVLLLLRGVGVPYALSILLCLAILYVYVQLCGAKPSAMRAYMMLFFVALAYLFRRKANSFNALLLSASLALLYEPKDLYNIGFLLSYCVVASIILYGISLYEYLSDKYKPYAMLPDKLLSLPQNFMRKGYFYLLMSFSVSFSAFLGGGFLCSYFFGYIAWASIINFLIFVPLLYVILILGFFSLIMPSFIGLVLNNLILYLLKFMTNIASFFSDRNFIIEIKIESIYILICGLIILFATLIYLRQKRDLRLIYLPISIFSLVLCC